LSAKWFEDLDDARKALQDWRWDYNDARPYSALGNIPPTQYVANLREWASP